MRKHDGRERTTGEGIKDLFLEVLYAVGKHPDPKNLFPALVEEIGEALREENPGKPGNHEWLQVSCVALRIYCQGAGGELDQELATLFLELETKARELQGESSV